jgi:membrane protein CcdC involved in cytochrome C biogenesis
MIKLNKKVAFAIFAVTLFCIGIVVDCIIENSVGGDKLSKWLLLFSFSVSAYVMFKIIYKSE